MAQSSPPSSPQHLAPDRRGAGLVLSLLGLIVIVACAGCEKPQPWEQEDPAEALKVYLASLELRSLDVTWEFLLPEDRAILEERKAALDALTGGDSGRDAWAMLNPGHVISTASEYKDVRVDEASSDDERATVVVELHDARSFTVQMLRRDGRWFVDLPLDQAIPARPAPKSQGGSDE